MTEIPTWVYYLLLVTVIAAGANGVGNALIWIWKKVHK